MEGDRASAKATNPALEPASAKSPDLDRLVPMYTIQYMIAG
jgi:hypothetical protein